MAEEKTKKKRIRGFPGVVKNQLEPLNQNDAFKHMFKDEKFKILLNTIDGKLAALVMVDKGTVDVDQVENTPKEAISKKNLGWDGKLATTTPLFLDLASGKLSFGKIVLKVITRKVKLKGIKNLLKLLKMFALLEKKEAKKAPPTN